MIALQSQKIRGSTVITRSGHYFDFLNPDPDTILIEDIAWALAYICRFGGRSLTYYSVAQHSFHVAEICSPENQLAGLMHDAAEAYVGDVVSPLKDLLPEYKAIEKRVEKVIFSKFGLPEKLPDEVKRADLTLLMTEKRDITAGANDTWTGLENCKPFSKKITPWPASSAALIFLDMFHCLTEGKYRE